MQTVFDRIKNFKIIDFHTHPFTVGDNICAHRGFFNMSTDDIIPTLTACGISAICGSVIKTEGTDKYANVFERIRDENRTALALKERLGDFYIPGFHIHPDFVEESIEEIKFMSERGVKLIGEIVPSAHGYDGYDREGLCPIFDEAARHSMTVSFHTMAHGTIEEMVKSHPDLTFVAAHPGERDTLLAHIERMKKYDNLYLDISGTGIFRYLSLSRLVREVGSERILFGSDYPTCNPGFFIGGVLTEPLADCDLENIFSKNAERILRIK